MTFLFSTNTSVSKTETSQIFYYVSFFPVSSKMWFHYDYYTTVSIIKTSLTSIFESSFNLPGPFDSVLCHMFY